MVPSNGTAADAPENSGTDVEMNSNNLEDAIGSGSGNGSGLE